MLESVERSQEKFEISEPEPAPEQAEEVAGKAKAQESSEYSLEARRRRTVAIQNILRKKFAKLGLDVFDLQHPTQELLRQLYFSLPEQILAGAKKTDDIDNEIKIALEQVKKNVNEEKKRLH